MAPTPFASLALAAGLLVLPAAGYCGGLAVTARRRVSAAPAVTMRSLRRGTRHPFAGSLQSKNRLRRANENDANKLFIGNMTLDTTDADITAWFPPQMPVVHVKVVKDQCVTGAGAASLLLLLPLLLRPPRHATPTGRHHYHSLRTSRLPGTRAAPKGTGSCGSGTPCRPRPRSRA